MTSPMRLGLGDRLLLGGSEYKVLRRIADDALQVECVADGRTRTMTDSDLARAQISEALTIVSSRPVSRAATTHPMFSELSEETKANARRRLRYLDGLERLGISSYRRDETIAALAALAQEHGEKPPSYASICRWRRRAGEVHRLSNLADRQGNKGNRNRRLRLEVQGIINTAIEERYMRPENETANGLLANVRHRINQANLLRPAEDPLICPSIKAIRSALKELDPYDVAVAKKGKRKADHMFNASRPTERPPHPLSLVEMDHTKLDVFVIDDESYLPLGRPWLTMAVDKHSRMPVGFLISFTSPSAHTVMQCLRNAILPKTWLKERFPEVENGWPCHGVPDELSLDRGLEFLGNDLVDICADLGIHIRHSPARRPWFKGYVERYFGALNTDLLHKMPGTTFSNIIERDEYDPAKNAVITFSKLITIAHKWVVDIFARQGHGREKRVPYFEWEEGCRISPVRPISHVSDLDALLGRVERRTLQRTGIELMGLNYVSDDLVAWRHDPSFLAIAPDCRVKIKFDPSDLSTIKVLDPRTLRYEVVPVVASQAGYATGLSEWQHRTVSQHARTANFGRVDLDALARAREHIMEMVADCLGEKRSRIRTRQKAARFAGIGVREAGHPDGHSAPRQQTPTVVPLRRPQAAVDHSGTLDDIDIYSKIKPPPSDDGEP